MSLCQSDRFDYEGVAQLIADMAFGAFLWCPLEHLYLSFFISFLSIERAQRLWARHSYTVWFTHSVLSPLNRLLWSNKSGRNELSLKN